MNKLYLIFIILVSNHADQSRSFSNQLLSDYKQLTINRSLVGTHKKIARVSIDMLVLLMEEASHFDFKTMRKIQQSPNLFIDSDFYSNWKYLLRGQSVNQSTEAELSQLQKLEKVTLVDSEKSRLEWSQLLHRTETIIRQVSSKQGFDIVLKQNTVLGPFSVDHLSRFSVVSSNITDITMLVADQILRLRGWSSDKIKEFKNLLELKMIR